LTTPLSTTSGNRLTQPLARPRVIYSEDVATLSVRVRDKGKSFPHVLVHFQPVNGTGGRDSRRPGCNGASRQSGLTSRHLVLQFPRQIPFSKVKPAPATARQPVAAAVPLQKRGRS
jgi:hypothetical protein